jgi:hypothetical protein
LVILQSFHHAFFFPQLMWCCNHYIRTWTFQNIFFKAWSDKFYFVQIWAFGFD